MRLWHQKLIRFLPRQQLLGQHRECCALRGAGWGRKHAIVNYVFTYSPDHLVAYHHLVMEEMERRGYHPDTKWYNCDWRGNKLLNQENWSSEYQVNCIKTFCRDNSVMIFKEHNESYLKECLDNLLEKGITINFT